MRFLTELLIFLVIAAVAAVIGSTVIWLVGLPVQLSFGHSVWLAVVGLVFVFPGAANMWIMFRGSGGEGMGERALAGVRGLAMLLAAFFAVSPSLFKGVGLKMYLLSMGSCLAVVLVTLPLNDWLSSRRRQHPSSQGPNVTDSK